LHVVSTRSKHVGPLIQTWICDILPGYGAQRMNIVRGTQKIVLTLSCHDVLMRLLSITPILSYICFPWHQQYHSTHQKYATECPWAISARNPIFMPVMGLLCNVILTLSHCDNCYITHRKFLLAPKVSGVTVFFLRVAPDSIDSLYSHLFYSCIILNGSNSKYLSINREYIEHVSRGTRHQWSLSHTHNSHFRSVHSFCLVCLFVWVLKTHPITGLSGWRAPD